MIADLSLSCHPYLPDMEVKTKHVYLIWHWPL